MLGWNVGTATHSQEKLTQSGLCNSSSTLREQSTLWLINQTPPQLPNEKCVMDEDSET
jgi:hypothetical protein